MDSLKVLVVERFPQLLGALNEWQKKGYPIVSREVFEERHKQCRTCEHHYEIFFPKIGICKKCACSTVKLFLSTSECPLLKEQKRWQKDENTKTPTDRTL